MSSSIVISTRKADSCRSIDMSAAADQLINGHRSRRCKDGGVRPGQAQGAQEHESQRTRSASGSTRTRMMQPRIFRDAEGMHLLENKWSALADDFRTFDL